MCAQSVVDLSILTNFLSIKRAVSRKTSRDSPRALKRDSGLVRHLSGIMLKSGIGAVAERLVVYVMRDC